jgi:ABC-2 type transport system ATP-binding protein
MKAIEIDSLTKDYGDVVGIDSISFGVESGEIFGFLGPNGAGKTTTIRTLLGLLSPTSGTATVLGADVRDNDALVDVKQRIGYLPADLGFDEGVTGEKELAYHESVKGGQRREELLEIFTPPLNRPIREYSTGNKRMLGIVQAFMHDPELVIMDEPTAGLDPLKQEEFYALVHRERERGTTIFFSSHVLSEVRRICDRVGILREGQIVGLEDVETLLERGGKRVRIYTAEKITSDITALDGVADVTELRDGIQFLYTGEYNRLFGELSAYDISDIKISEPPLEDIFLQYYGSGVDDISSQEGEADV